MTLRSPDAAEPPTAPVAEQCADISHRPRMSLLLVVGLLVVIILFGLEVAVPLILLLLLLLVAREAWRTTIVTTVQASGGLYLVFHAPLDVPLVGGKFFAN